MALIRPKGRVEYLNMIDRANEFITSQVHFRVVLISFSCKELSCELEIA
jgi:hypothetical protein